MHGVEGRLVAGRRGVHHAHELLDLLELKAVGVHEERVVIATDADEHAVLAVRGPGLTREKLREHRRDGEGGVALQLEDAHLATERGAGLVHHVGGLLHQRELRVVADENELVAGDVLDDERAEDAHVRQAARALLEDLANLRRGLRGAAALERKDLHVPHEVRAGAGLELINEQRGGLDVLRLAGDDEAAVLRIHHDGHALDGAPGEVEPHQRVGENLRDGHGVSGLEPEDARVAALSAGAVELLDQTFHDRQFVRRAGHDDAVRVRFGEDDGVQRRGAGPQTGLFGVKRLERERHAEGVPAGQVEETRLTHLARRRAADLGEDGLNLHEVVRARGDDDAAIACVGQKRRVSGVGQRARPPALFVERAHKRHEADDFVGGAEVEHLRRAVGGRGLEFLQVVEDAAEQLQLRVVAREDELAAGGVVHHEQLRHGQLRLVLHLVVVELARLREQRVRRRGAELHDLNLARRLLAERLVELLNDGGHGGQLLRVAGHDERAGLGVHGNGHALLHATGGVVTHQRGGEDLGDLRGIGGFDFENARGRALPAGGVEFLDEVGNRFQLGGVGDDDQPVRPGVRRDERVRRARAKPRLRLFEIKRPHRDGQLDGARGGEVEDARVADGGAGLAGSELLDQRLDFLHVLGPARDDEPPALRVRDDLRVGGVGLGLVLPLLGVELHHDGQQALHVVGGADFNGLRLAQRRGRRGGLDLGEDGFDSLQMFNAGVDDDAARDAVADHLRVRRAELRVGGELVLVELERERHDALGLGEFPEINDLRLARGGLAAGERVGNLLNPLGLLLRAVDRQARAARVGVNRRRLLGLAGGLLGVDGRDLGQQLGGRGVLHRDGLQLALGLVGLGIERLEQRLDLRQHGVRREDDEAAAVGGNADQVCHHPAAALGHEDLRREGGQRVGVAAHLDEFHALGLLQVRRVNAFVVEALDDGLRVLQVRARAGHHDAVRLRVRRDGDAADGLVAGVEAHHRVRDDAHDLDGRGVVELEDSRAARALGGLVELLDDGAHGEQLIARAAEDEAVRGSVGDNLDRRRILRPALALEQLGDERRRERGDGGGVALLQLHHAHLARLRLARCVELRNDLRRGLDRVRLAAEDQAVAARVHEHLHGLGLRVKALLDEAGNLGGQRRLEPNDARFLTHRLLADGVELPDDGFDAGDFRVRAADHDAVVLRVGDDRGRAAGRLALPPELLGVELRDERGQVGGRPRVQLHGAELAGQILCRGGVELHHQLAHAGQILRRGQHDDLLAAGVGDELRLHLRVRAGAAHLREELGGEGDDFGRGLGAHGEDNHLAALRRGREVHNLHELLNLLQLLRRGGDEHPVVRVVSDDGGLGLAFVTAVSHAVGEQLLEAGEDRFHPRVLERDDGKLAVQHGAVLAAQLLHQLLDAQQVRLACSDDEPAVLVVHQLRVRADVERARPAHLIAVKLLDQRQQALRVRRRADLNEPRLQRLRLRGDGLQLRENLRGRLQVAGRTGDDDALAGRVERDARSGVAGAPAAGLAASERLRDNGGKVLWLGGARAVDLRER